VLKVAEGKLFDVPEHSMTKVGLKQLAAQTAREQNPHRIHADELAVHLKRAVILSRFDHAVQLELRKTKEAQRVELKKQEAKDKRLNRQREPLDKKVQEKLAAKNQKRKAAEESKFKTMEEELTNGIKLAKKKLLWAARRESEDIRARGLDADQEQASACDTCFVMPVILKKWLPQFNSVCRSCDVHTCHECKSKKQFLEEHDHEVIACAACNEGEAYVGISIACDVCNEWYHMTCEGILSKNKIPNPFVCSVCLYE
jgi:hypothetical protein